MHRQLIRQERAFVCRKQRGVALLMVLGFLALLGSVVADFQFSSQIDVQLALNARDELQAEMNALSALRFRALLLKQSRKMQTLVESLMGSLGGGAQAPPIGVVLEALPVECGLMSAITKKVDKTLDGENAEEDFFPGECLATSESEHSKIAINLLRNTIEGRAAQVQMNLLGILSDVRMLKFFQENDRNGQHAESPVALIGHITDWVDTDHTETGSFGDEDRYYQYLKEPYRAKNAPFDSVEELRLVHGMNDALFELLKDQITVYNADAKIEIATAPIDRIVYWGLPASLADGVPPAALAPFLFPIIQQLQIMKSIGMGFSALSTKSLSSAITTVGAQQVIDMKKLPNVFKDGVSTTWYTIKAEGHMGRASRRIRAVFQASEGSFYYVRVD